MTAIQFLVLIFSYLSGAVPYGYIFTRKATGLNILEMGSGNIGSTNVRRVAGRRIALFVQVFDMMKGFIPVALVLYFNQKVSFLNPEYFVQLVALSAIVGHNFSLFLSFRGGKGVNTTLGASILIAPLSVICAIAVYLLVKWQFKFVSAGSMALALMLALSGVFLHYSSITTYYLIICGGLILIRHYSNIKRLLAGDERK